MLDSLPLLNTTYIEADHFYPYKTQLLICVLLIIFKCV